eukprot:CAMPEP_0172082968 /NCGR_PEP_ID=MMETSP1043-20130122/20170_1 /TAXON_ID=464988 /ORGANISM="Hemiselmis andersenii, Strain CCMP441" /LENGTH=70 /DNA_ID=CAMNT_0012744615 /DNA_START=162 /DNA_END=371 /DNA_ORIENTATION=-
MALTSLSTPGCIWSLKLRSTTLTKASMHMSMCIALCSLISRIFSSHLILASLSLSSMPLRNASSCAVMCR